MNKLYLAYGANTNLQGMRRRCPNALRVQSIEIPDYQLVFRGVADIEPQKGKTLLGVLWNLTKECEESLDRFEGFPWCYRKETLEIGDSEVMYYKMNSKDIAVPSRDYYSTIKEGYIENALPTGPLQIALEVAQRWDRFPKKKRRRLFG